MGDESGLVAVGEEFAGELADLEPQLAQSDALHALQGHLVTRHLQQLRRRRHHNTPLKTNTYQPNTYTHPLITNRAK